MPKVLLVYVERKMAAEKGRRVDESVQNAGDSAENTDFFSGGGHQHLDHDGNGAQDVGAAAIIIRTLGAVSGLTLSRVLKAGSASQISNASTTVSSRSSTTATP